MRVNLSTLPTFNTPRTMDFSRLDGGLNLQVPDWRLDSRQSPEMKNLWWQDGLLQCRDGQTYLLKEGLGQGYACHDSLFFGRAFFHMGGVLCCGDVRTMELQVLMENVPENRGTFFRYLDWLFYKNRGGFYRISYDDGIFRAEDMVSLAHVPTILLNADPETGSGDLYQPENRLSAQKRVKYNAAADVKVYHLPVQDIDAISEVRVDGEIPESGYTVDLRAGTVTFTDAPRVQNPPVNNTVEIVYEKANPKALASILDCPYAVVYGGDTNVCILLGGCTEQPNAVFWNSNDELSMDPGYWPMSYYNLAGDTAEAVTGFGRQYSDLMVLKTGSVGRLTLTTQEIDGRQSISFVYATVNSRIGCDVPWTIQLIENNLVFLNSSTGVHIIRSSSAAYENNISCISRNINGQEARGLLNSLRTQKDACSFDDGRRYWLNIGDVVYLWDYSISSLDSPSWFYFEGVSGVAYFRNDEGGVCHLDRQGAVTAFIRNFADYDRPIEKVYRFPTLNFGTYDRLKDVTSVLFSVRSDTSTEVSVRYDTDYESRQDKTHIRSTTWRLVPRNLAERNLTVNRYATTVRRKPRCHHVRHFSMTLSDCTFGCDLAVASAQVQYRFVGKQK